MPKFRKKPVVIEAVQFTGNNWNQIRAFIGRGAKMVGRKVRVPTLEGHIYAKETDWIIRGINGEVYPCDNEIFWKTYEEVPDASL